MGRARTCWNTTKPMTIPVAPGEVLWVSWGSWALSHRAEHTHPAQESEALTGEPLQAPPLLMLPPRWSSRSARTCVSYKLAAALLCPPDLPRISLVAPPNGKHTRKGLWGLQFILVTLIDALQSHRTIQKQKNSREGIFTLEGVFTGERQGMLLAPLWNSVLGHNWHEPFSPSLSLSCIIHESLCTDMERSLRPLVKWKELVIKQYA